MNILLYLIFFAMGSVFGSFLTLATYRIPLNQDISHERSYCPKCNHKLSFLDLIPILSYVFLGGKCRYCKSKISIRYLIMETLCGLSFVVLALLLRINVYKFELTTAIEYGIGILYIVFLFLIAGIDKEHAKIDKRVLIYGIIVSVIYMAYQIFMQESFDAIRFIVYLIAIAIITITNTYQIKKKGKNAYQLNLLIICIIMALLTYELATIFSIIVTLLIVAIKIILNKVINKDKKYTINISSQPIAFYLAISNAISVVFIYVFYLLGAI